MLTVEKLKEVNQSYHYNKGITEKETEKANSIATVITKAAQTKNPQVGDIVLYTTEHGDYHANAVIEKIDSKKFYICEAGSLWAGINGQTQKHYISVGSGGSFKWLDIEKLEATRETKERTFQTWGRNGAEANGAFYFPATVKVWIYNEINKYAPYSTKLYNKYYIHKNDNPEAEYMFRASLRMRAWETYKDFNAWLLKNRAVIFEHYNNSYVVFTYKKESILLSELAYNNLTNYTEKDIHKINASWVEVKRMIRGTTQKLITEYRYSNRNNDESLEEYRKNHHNQLFMNDKRNKDNAICLKVLKPIK